MATGTNAISTEGEAKAKIGSSASATDNKLITKDRVLAIDGIVNNADSYTNNQCVKYSDIDKKSSNIYTWYLRGDLTVPYTISSTTKPAHNNRLDAVSGNWVNTYYATYYKLADGTANMFYPYYAWYGNSNPELARFDQLLSNAYIFAVSNSINEGSNFDESISEIYKEDGKLRFDSFNRAEIFTRIPAFDVVYYRNSAVQVTPFAYNILESRFLMNSSLQFSVYIIVLDNIEGQMLSYNFIISDARSIHENFLSARYDYIVNSNNSEFIFINVHVDGSTTCTHLPETNCAFLVTSKYQPLENSSSYLLTITFFKVSDKELRPDGSEYYLTNMTANLIDENTGDLIALRFSYSNHSDPVLVANYREASLDYSAIYDISLGNNKDESNPCYLTLDREGIKIPTNGCILTNKEYEINYSSLFNPTFKYTRGVIDLATQTDSPGDSIDNSSFVTDSILANATYSINSPDRSHQQVPYLLIHESYMPGSTTHLVDLGDGYIGVPENDFWELMTNNDRVTYELKEHPRAIIVSFPLKQWAKQMTDSGYPLYLYYRHYYYKFILI